jgi:polysaccharide biosynthesis/export protein
MQLSQTFLRVTTSVVFAGLLAVIGTGCQTAVPSFDPVTTQKIQPTTADPVTLKEGDTLRIEFPGAPNLNTRQQIRRDGKIVLSLVGEVTAVGKTQAELEKELIRLYASQIVSKEITVAVESSSFPIFVSGAVLRPGRITSDRPITALEAIIDAGFDHSKANLKAVKIIRNVNGQPENIILDLDSVIKGKSKEPPFYLKPSDIIFVPEKFRWY